MGVVLFALQSEDGPWTPRSLDECLGVQRALGRLKEAGLSTALHLATALDTGIATADALIAATALTHRISMMTCNRRHFDRIAGLRVIAPA